VKHRSLFSLYLFFFFLSSCGDQQLQIIERIELNMNFADQQLTADFFTLGDLGSFKSSSASISSLGSIELIDRGEKDLLRISTTLSESKRTQAPGTTIYQQLPDGSRPARDFRAHGLHSILLSEAPGSLSLLMSKGTHIVFGMEWKDEIFSKLPRGFRGEQRFVDVSGSKKISLLAFGPTERQSTGALVILSDFGISPFDRYEKFPWTHEANHKIILYPEEKPEPSSWSWLPNAWRQIIVERFQEHR
jgi:hypothetical protein